MGPKSNLTYEAHEPAFLARIRATQSGQDTDRHDRAIARPKRPRKDDDDDDGPTYVDEDNEVVEKKDVEALVAGDGDKVENGDAGGEVREEEARKKQDVQEVGGAVKKRKSGKVVGGDDEEKEEGDGVDKKSAKKPKKKAKAVKLSFDED